jgi:hypothetical protein
MNQTFYTFLLAYWQFAWLRWLFWLVGLVILFVIFG